MEFPYTNKHNVIFLREAERLKSPTRTYAQAIIICPLCHEESTIRDGSALRLARKSCKKCSPKLVAEALTKTVPAYIKYLRNGMVSRCHNPDNKNYSSYGGRGITVCDEWKDPENGVYKLHEALGDRPSDKHSIDRIDNDKGYTQGNCRWATPTQQLANRRTRKGHIRERNNQFEASYKHIHLGNYPTEDLAQTAINGAIRIVEFYEDSK